jgi:hypothetical protein
MNFDYFGGRRFLLALFGGVSATVLQWFGKLDPAGMAFGLTIGSTVAAYITGNVIESKNNLMVGQNEPKP